MKKSIKNKKTIALIIATVILSVITVALASTVFLSTNAKVTMVDFTNQTEEEVTKWLKEKKVTDKQIIITQQYNETTAEKKVLSQSIKPGEKLGKKDVITIVVSKGKDPQLTETFADFTNKTSEEIKTWFTEHNFTTVTFEEIPHDTIKKGAFVKLSTTAKEAHRNEAITVFISAGANSVGVKITIPDFKDYSKANIEAWAKTNNVKVTFKSENNDTVASGKVISQSLVAGSTGKTGDSLSIVLSLGKGITLTNFTGKNREEFAKFIKNNNLKATYTEVYDNKVLKGLIISQDPKSGNLKEGNTVKVTVSMGKPVIDNYTDKTKDAFIKYITNLNGGYGKTANIKYEFSEIESTKPVGAIAEQVINGKVVTAATQVDIGTTVYIKIAKPKSVNVVNKTGLKEVDFFKYLIEIKCKTGTKTEKYSDSIAAGSIISNDTGNKQEGSTINYELSIGIFTPTIVNGSTTFNDLKNSIDAANKKGAGFTLTSTNEFHATLNAGTIISYSVSGKTITTKVSSGAGVIVGNYVGQPSPCGGSVQACQVGNLKFSIVQEQTYSSEPLNQVKAQSVASGSTVAIDTTITLTVSKGPDPTSCPSGQTYNPTTKKCETPVTEGATPSINTSGYAGQPTAAIKSDITNKFTVANFTNLTFIETLGDTPSVSISPAADGSIKPFNTAFTITICAQQ